jgi:hypothetical protein
MRELRGVDPRAIDDDILSACEPCVLRGLVAAWPAVQAGLASAQDASAYLRALGGDTVVGAWLGAPEIDGRFFYNHDLSGFNFQPQRLKLAAVLDQLEQLQDLARPSALYVGSTTVDTCLPGFRQANDVALGARDALASIWIGNRTRIAAHHDVPDNLACVVAGRRRFTLFPPSELPNLYIGPLDFTPAGQAISLVDFAHPDLERFPRFAQALERALVVDLEPGDAVFIPSMWWHHVEALEPFNVLVNYWWRQSPEHMDSPMAALFLALMTVRDLPPVQRQAWRTLFEHYVFGADDHTAAHVPPPARGALAPMDDERSARLRAELIRRLKR